ncbi:MAG: hypothetical protein IPG44_19130 [Anaerolineales bacterium]|nr:hypothetical protein [Chloroflexota bacterium]MBK6647827.1 hypothetical protein [Anaerolineales bacterium]MCC6985425.1 hypothetical protein [Anaerolineales bacterium]
MPHRQGLRGRQAQPSPRRVPPAPKSSVRRSIRGRGASRGGDAYSILEKRGWRSGAGLGRQPGGRAGAG